MNDTVVTYQGQQVSVTKKVADFLERDRRRVRAQYKQDQRLIFLRYDEELSMDEIGRQLGVSRMAISKRLRTLHRKLERAVTRQRGSIFLFPMVYKLSPSVLCE